MGTFPQRKSPWGLASFHMAQRNTLSSWDAAAGCASNSAHTPSYLASPPTDGLPTFIHDNRPTTVTFHLEFAGVHTISLSPTPSLIRVNSMRSLGVPALTGHYLVDMLPRDSLSSETQIIVTDGLQTILLSGFTDLEPGTVLETCSCPLIQIRTSTLHDPPTEPLPTSPTGDILSLIHI